MSVGIAVADLTVAGPRTGSDADTEMSKRPPSLILEIPTTGAMPIPTTGRDERKQHHHEINGVVGQGAGQVRPEANSVVFPPTSSLPSTSSSTSSSTFSATSPSSSFSSSTATADTSVTSDTHHLNFTLNDNHVQKEYKDLERENSEQNDDTPRTNETPFPVEVKPDIDAGEHIHPVDANTNTDTTTTNITTANLTSTPASTTVASSSIAASSSTTSLAATSPSPSLSSPPSSPTTNPNNLTADPNGLLSLLRPRFQSSPNLNVKFAPFPELAPRKRKSNTPLGMAARSQLAQRRRMYQDRYDYEAEYEGPRSRRYHYVNPSEMPTEEEAAKGSREKKKAKKKAAATEGQDENGEKKKSKEKGEKDQGGDDDLDQMPGDPFVSLAKKMGKAGKQFWKKVALAHVHGGKDQKGAGEENGQSAAEGAVVAETPTTATGEEGSQSASEGRGDASRDEERKSEIPADPGAEPAVPPMRILSPEQTGESPVEKAEEEGAPFGLGAVQLDEKATISPAPTLNSTPVS